MNEKSENIGYIYGEMQRIYYNKNKTESSKVGIICIMSIFLLFGYGYIKKL